MKIEVTQQHIHEGSKKSCFGCPIALALREYTNKTIGVGSECCWFTSDTESFNLPKKCIDFIKRFDNGGEVKPFSFELDLD